MEGTRLAKTKMDQDDDNNQHATPENPGQVFTFPNAPAPAPQTPGMAKPLQETGELTVISKSKALHYIRVGHNCIDFAREHFSETFDATTGTILCPICESAQVKLQTDESKCQGCNKKIGIINLHQKLLGLSSWTQAACDLAKRLGYIIEWDSLDKMAKAAVALSRQGLWVHPVYQILPSGVCSCHLGKECSQPGKHPRLFAWPNKATSAPEDVYPLWGGSYSGSNIGAMTGPKTGYFVLDIDGDVGIASLDGLIAANSPFPDTWTSLTGGGGRHYFFRYPSGAPVTNSAKKIAPGIDVRGTNGYVVVPPSKHKSGNAYQWLGGHAPGECALGEAPAWLVEMLASQVAQAGSPTEIENGAAHENGDISEGERNHALFRMAANLKDGKLPKAKALEHLVEFNNEHCLPPVPQRELHSILNSAYKRPTKARGRKRGHRPPPGGPGA